MPAISYSMQTSLGISIYFTLYSLIPEHSARNKRVQSEINRNAQGCLHGIANGRHWILHTTMNWGWRKALQIDSGEKEDIMEWCHEQWPLLPQIPHLEDCILKSGKNKGQRRIKVHDCYDAFCIALHGKLRHGGD